MSLQAYFSTPAKHSGILNVMTDNGGINAKINSKRSCRDKTIQTYAKSELNTKCHADNESLNSE